jgi:hypothetical protein
MAYHIFTTTKYRIWPPEGDPVYLTRAELECARRIAERTTQLPAGPKTARQLFPDSAADRRLVKRLARLGVLSQWLHGYGLCHSVRAQITATLERVRQEHAACMKEGRIMDPDVCWQTLCATLRTLWDNPEEQEARADAIQLVRNMADWLEQGGFPPALD